MAQNQQSTSTTDPTTFIKGMVKDVDDSFFPEGSWYHARNLVNNSKDGNEGTISNEPSNAFCNQAPFPIIGAIHLNADRWVIFSTDNTQDEIGVFEEDLCKYSPISNSLGQPMNQTNCLNFSQNNLIIGVAKENFDCSWQVYWADKARNPDRTLNVDKAAFIENCVTVANCITCTPTTALNCDLLRISALVITPCLEVSRGTNGGLLQNGSYYAMVAYVMNSQRVTDYYTPSNTQAIFEHRNSSGSLLVTVKQMDTEHFDYFELVIVRTINGQTSAKKMGIYSTRQAQISIDYINEALPSIPVEQLPIRTPNYESSDGIFEISNYMLRVGPRTKFDFNYQPLANLITAKWKAVAYPANYYKTGHNTCYMRDEVYPFFIRWVYNTAEKSSSYHIPGRPSRATDLGAAPLKDSIEILDPVSPYIPIRWEAVNTATTTATPNTTQADGGVLVAEGDMGYWQSTELYPDKKPNLYNATSQPWSNASLIANIPYSGTAISGYDLCGQPIRHHKFPENSLIPHTRILTSALGPNSAGSTVIQVLGVEFNNILPPLDNVGQLIPGIVGYEILRGSREGNKTVIAKGMLNNMRTYMLDTDTTTTGPTGLYPNYPYNPIGPDQSISTTETKGGTNNAGAGTPATGVSFQRFTFHSPDTQFNNPFLSAKELKVYGEVWGTVTGSFDETPYHPKEKLMTDVAFFVSAFVGVGLAIQAIRGQREKIETQPHLSNIGAIGTVNTIPSSVVGAGVLSGYYGAAVPLDASLGTGIITNFGSGLLSGIYTYDDITKLTTQMGIQFTPAVEGYTKTINTQETAHGNMPILMKAFSAVPVFSHYWTLGTDATLDFMRAIVPYTQYAMRYTSHGDMHNFTASPASNQHRFILTDASYITDGFYDFGKGNTSRINNKYRGPSVALETSAPVPATVNTDNTVQTIGSCINGNTGLSSINTNISSFFIDDVKQSFNTQAAANYVALKQRMRNQYGQLEGIIQVPASYCSINVTLPLTAGTVVPSSGIVFNGDTYVTRYTEKNSFFYFWDWLDGQPDGYEFNYKLRYMLNYPRYWANFEKFDPAEFLSSFVTGILSLSFGSIIMPNDRSRLDGKFLPSGGGGLGTTLGNLLVSAFRVTQRYFYTFQSGVRDFYVESEINTALRDYGDPEEERFYDAVGDGGTDIRKLFDPKIIKDVNFFKYDQSLSVSRVFNNFFSWGNIQDRDYDPYTAETCYVYYKKRVIYSLPQNLEAKRDFWRVFLANNYKDFKSTATAVVPINKSGAMFFFHEESPIMYQGVDTLQTELGTKITIGDGGLFSQPEQSVVNANESYEYGSCQNRLSIANTPVGLFWISENQGKILRYSQGIKVISDINLKFWFSRYLPYRLTLDFPNFDLTDNPVAGIGCQAIFNNIEAVLYFTKKDYKLKPAYTGLVTYTPGIGFSIGLLPIKLGDPVYFDDASWTVSFDPKNETWQSFHDWHPDLMIPSKTFHLTTNKQANGTGGIWKHTNSQLSFCNFYGIDYPWEIDYVAHTGQTVNTVRSIEYFMEAHIYRNDKSDFYHVLDYNFDHAIMYNSEQVSGVLILNDTPKNNLAAGLLYPIVNPTSIDILFDKVEQKYRFNQFWDITADRGEYTYPNVQRQIWQTEDNGYIRALNPANLNYNKDPFQRKKFRHFANHLLLYKNVSNNVKMLMKISNNKNLVSMR
jgi:hypothetical protein